jgi:hypothetical protein
MRADSACDVAESVASRCSAHKTVGARADAAAIDVSRKKWRRDGAELITFFNVQPCDVLAAAASVWNVMANKIWANFHGVYLVGMSMRSSSRRLHPVGDEAHHPWREYVGV